MLVGSLVNPFIVFDFFDYCTLFLRHYLFTLFCFVLSSHSTVCCTVCAIFCAKEYVPLTRHLLD